MRELPNLWRTLDGAAFLAGVEVQWREWLGDELELVRPYLRPEQQLAASYPCENPTGDGCPRDVVVHDEDDIVAACGCSPARCKPIPLKRKDLIVYDFDARKLGRDIARLIGLEDERPQVVDDVTGVYHLGSLSCGPGVRAPVLLALQCGVDDERYTVHRLVATREDAPRVLVVAQPLEQRVQALATSRGLAVVACSDVLGRDDTGILALRVDREKLLIAIQGQLRQRLPSGVRDAPATPPYQTERRLSAPASDPEQICSSLREANGLEPLDVVLSDGVFAVGLLCRRGKRIPVVWIQESVRHLGMLSLGLQQQLQEDGLVVVTEGERGGVSQISDSRAVHVVRGESEDLKLWRALDVLDPSYRQERVSKKEAVFDDIEVELAHESGVRHIVRVNGREIRGLQRSNLKFLRFLLLAAKRKAECDVDGGGWILKAKLEGDERDRDVEALRKALRSTEPPGGLSKEELGALIKASPQRDGKIRLAVDPRRVSFDKSLEGLRLVEEIPGATKGPKSTSGSQRYHDNLQQGREKARNLIKRARDLGAPLPRGDGGEEVDSIPA